MRQELGLAAGAALTLARRWTVVLRTGALTALAAAVAAVRRRRRCGEAGRSPSNENPRRHHGDEDALRLGHHGVRSLPGDQDSVGQSVYALLRCGSSAPLRSCHSHLEAVDLGAVENFGGGFVSRPNPERAHRTFFFAPPTSRIGPTGLLVRRKGRSECLGRPSSSSAAVPRARARLAAIANSSR
jgi:hypothetical protein